MDNKTVRNFMEEGYNVSPSVADQITEEDLKNIKSSDMDVNFVDGEILSKLRADSTNTSERKFNTKVEIEKNFEGSMNEKDVPEFVQYYNDRFFRLKKMLSSRVELSDAVSIGRLDDYGDKENLSIIGMVTRKYKTGSGKWIVYVEDDSGRTKVLVDEDKGGMIIPDEVLGFKGVTGDDIVFSNEVVRPDIPLSRNMADIDDDVYAAFMSDLHFGSKSTFVEKAFRFAEWLGSGRGISSKVGYLFINGDVVAGIGNYPGQEKNLEITDLYEQYSQFESFVKILPDDLEIIVSPGNHDLVRLAEPQPPFSEKACPDIHDKDNVHMVSNPATVKIHGFDGQGIRVLMYHGYSFDNHVDAIKDLRENAYEEPCRCMVDLIKRRHLAPTYSSNLISPEKKDYLVIENIPDIFVMGHTHAFDVSNYKGINLISAGTMQGQTDFQKRMGHKPDPGEIAMVNLKTRDVKVKKI